MAAKKKTPIKRNKKGQWVKGESGNPYGRPVGTKNHIVQLKHQLEIAVRENLNPTKVRKVIEVMTDRALGGDVSAAKLILDKVLSNAKVDEEPGDGDREFTIRITNATVNLGQGEDNEKPVEGIVIENNEGDT